MQPSVPWSRATLECRWWAGWQAAADMEQSRPGRTVLAAMTHTPMVAARREAAFALLDHPAVCGRLLVHNLNLV